MRKLLAVILIVFLTQSGCVGSNPPKVDLPDGEHKVYFDDGTLSGILNVKNGILDGWTSSYRPNGTLERKVLYDNGSLVRKQFYDELSNLTQDADYTNGTQDGIASYYAKDGTKTKTCELKANKTHGQCKTYFPNGNIKEIWHKKNNQYYGTYARYFSDGSMQAIGNYRNGKTHGVSKTYYKNHDLHSEAEYDDGKMMWFKIYYQNGGLRGHSKINKENNMETIAYYESGEKSNEGVVNLLDGNGNITHYHPTGYILERCVISQAKPPDCVSAEKDGKEVNGLVKMFNKQNKLLSELNYMNGKSHGTTTAYFLSGKVSRVTEYKNGEIIREKKFYESGSVEYEQKEDKRSTLYDEDGNVLSSGSEKELLQQMGNLAR